jgi:hypothetical protein
MGSEVAVVSLERTQMTQAMCDLARAGLGELTAEERRETYVVSFFIYDEEDDPRSPTLTVGTNTASRVNFALHQPKDFVKPNPWWTPTDEGEAKWNYAFWLQNRLRVFPSGPADRDLCDRWLRVSGLWFEEPANANDWAPLGSRITAQFVEVCIGVAKALHEDGDIAAFFGRTIPVIVHELEYYDQIVDQTLKANPPGVADEFAAWVRSLELRAQSPGPA